MALINLEWKLFHPGKERLWEEDVWSKFLHILSRHIGEAVYDENSAIYSELVAELPEFTWSTKENGNFRPEFRDHKIAWEFPQCISTLDNKFELTSNGQQFVQGTVSRLRLFIKAMQSYREEFDGQPINPFQLIAKAFWQTGEPLTLRDIHCAVMQGGQLAGATFSEDLIAARATDRWKNYSWGERNEVPGGVTTTPRKIYFALWLMSEVQAIRLVKHGTKIDHLWVPWDRAYLSELCEDTLARAAGGLEVPNLGLGRLVEEFERGLATCPLKASRISVTRVVSSLLAKRFLIFTGLAGSGKTKLAQAFARWITESTDDDTDRRIAVVPVGADWTGNENILGYPNGLKDSEYVSKASLDLILHAMAHRAEPHFLILDEMNLSHVERYFADILSVIESDERIQLHRDTDRKANGKSIPAQVELPRNLFIVGTVNVDETTYMFSPKVLDRANVIEFRMGESELEAFLGDPSNPDLSKVDGTGYAGFGQAFVDAAVGPAGVPEDAKVAFDSEMLLFFKVLQAHGAEFGYRVAYEAARFVYFYKLLGNHPNDGSYVAGAFDCVIVQKLLPKLHGSRAKLGPLLKSLWFLCVNNIAERGAESLEAALDSARSTDKTSEPSTEFLAGPFYPLSAEKISRMWRLLRDNGFASFAEA